MGTFNFRGVFGARGGREKGGILWVRVLQEKPSKKIDWVLKEFTRWLSEGKKREEALTGLVPAVCWRHLGEPWRRRWLESRAYLSAFTV